MSPMDVKDRVDRVGPVLGTRTARTMAVDVDECGSDEPAGRINELALRRGLPLATLDRALRTAALRARVELLPG